MSVWIVFEGIAKILIQNTSHKCVHEKNKQTKATAKFHLFWMQQNLSSLNINELIKLQIVRIVITACWAKYAFKHFATNTFKQLEMLRYFGNIYSVL